MMDGFAGQQVVIDFDNNRIITAHSTDRHYDYYSLIYSQLEPDTSYKPNEQSDRNVGNMLTKHNLSYENVN